MSGPLILSVFPGIDLLGRAFEEVWPEACVVRGPDLLWGGDIRTFHPPAGRFDGVIGGPPCPAFSSAANIARAAGKAVAPDLIPEFARVLRESAPAWWVMENVESAYPPVADARAHCFDNRWVGGVQHRVRCFWSNLKLDLEWAALEAIDRRPTAAMSVWKGGRQYGDHTARRLREVIADQEIPEGFALPGFTVRASIQAVVNGVPMAMGRAVARAVRRAVEGEAVPRDRDPRG